MDEHPCAECEAQNRDDAAYCWQCYTPLRGAAATASTVATRPGAIRSATVGGFGDGNGGAVLTSPASPVQTTPGGSSWGWVLKAILFVAAFVGGWWLVNHLFFSGFPFPDEVAGHQRLDSEQARDAAEALTAFGEAFDLEMETAFYGPEIQPAYLMFVFEMPESLPFLGNQPLAGSADSLPFQCQEQVQGTSCYWSADDGQVVGLAGLGKTAEEVEPVARQVHTELQA
jgi:hypothetical protein